MALTNNPQNSNSLFSAASKQYNINQQSSEDLYDIVKSLNIVDPDALSKKEISNILKRIDDYNGLFTTQQLENVNYSKFNEHVFFDSAINKISYSFDRIQNMPYDQDELTNIKYANLTDGYTNYIMKNVYPRCLGYAKFSGSEQIVIYDHQGKLLNDSKTKKIGILNPGSRRYSFDFWLKVNSSSFVNNQMVFKKFDHTNNKQNGFICFLTDGTISTNCYINFAIFVDGKYTHSKTLISINENSEDIFQNIVISVSLEKGSKKINFLVNGNIVDDNDIDVSASKLKNMAFGEKYKDKNLPLVLGGIFLINDDESLNTSLVLNINNADVTFANMKGSIDEFRFFHKVRSSKTIKKEMHKNIYAQKDLALYLRLNEPEGDYQNACLVIDYSGNKLHGIIYKYDINTSTHSIVEDTSGFKINETSPLNLENKNDSPVLNSLYIKTIGIRKDLVDKAKIFDKNNPNLIFNLLPKHYFLNASDFQNLPVFSNTNEYANPSSIVKSDGTLSKPTTLNSTIPANNELVNIVLIWARFFDQLKLYIGSITNILNVDYDSINSEKIVGMQIPILCKMYGIKFKELLPSPTKSKLNKENLNYNDIVSDYSIRKIQNILWQRFLINTQDFLRSKGTIKSIDTVFNSFGIDHTKFIEIKEYSSFNDITSKLNYSLLNLKKYAINFGNKLELMKDPSYTNLLNNDYSNNKLLLKIEDIKTQTAKNGNITTNSIDGFNLDWSIELFFNFKEIIDKKRLLSSNDKSGEYFKDKQCLLRIDTDGDPSLIIMFEKNNSSYSSYGKITISIQPIKNNNSYNIDLDILNVNIFDLPKYLCITQSVDLESNKISYNAYLDNIGNQLNIKDHIFNTTTTEEIAIRNHFNVITSTLEDIANVNDVQNKDYNLSFYKNDIDISIGNYNYTGNKLLSATISGTNDTNFQGELLKVRLWNKPLSKSEVISHSNNIENIGTSNNSPFPSLISDFEVKDIKGTISNNEISWNIQDASNNLKSNDLSSLNSCIVKSRDVNLTDSIINNIHLLCKVKNCKIDEPISSNRFNIISYANAESKIQINNFNDFPSNSNPVDFKYNEISRVSLDMSIVKIINSDISNMISDLNLFTSKISNSHSIFSYSYKELESERNKYFEKYSDENLINYSSIGNVFKYFDNIMSSILYDIIPSKVRFEGFNFVYESHILERHKYEHKNYNSTISISDFDNYASYSRETSANRRNIEFNNNRKLIDTRGS